MIANTNDGSSKAPSLRCYLNGGNVAELPAFSAGPKPGDNKTTLAAIKAAGYDGVQGWNPTQAREFGLGCAAGGRVDKPAEADAFAAKLAGQGYDCATLHVGNGMENDDEVVAILEAIVAASVKHKFPLYVETHRATVTQDIWRTVQWAKRVPDIRFNGDFSHWYTGLEMVYGDINKKFDFMAPVFERTRFIHGRIGNPGSMQVDIGDGAGRTYVDHFKEMWTRSFLGFLRTAKPGDFITYAPELLYAKNYYARTFKNAQGEDVEEGDRWTQAILYMKIAKECFAEAQRRLAAKAQRAEIS